MLNPLRMLAGACTLMTSLTATADATHGASTRTLTRMHLSKSTHALTLYEGDAVVGSFRASLGPGGPGHKKQEGDNVTPVGHYQVVSHQASQYRVFLRLDYPNTADRARFETAKATGALPKNAHIGGDIGIHGTPQSHEYDAERASFWGVDWTAGCIGVQDDEIDRIAAWAKDGTIIDIED